MLTSSKLGLELREERGSQEQRSYREAVLGEGTRKEEGRWGHLESTLPHGRCRTRLKSVTKCLVHQISATMLSTHFESWATSESAIQETGIEGTEPWSFCFFQSAARQTAKKQELCHAHQTDMEASRHSRHTTRDIWILDAHCSA